MHARRRVVHCGPPAPSARCAVFQFARSFVIAALVFLSLGQTPASPPAQQPAPSQQPPSQQQPSQQPSQQPRFRTDTNLVRVDVYATRGGVPVQDLTAADFELSEDNAAQRIDTFEHIVVTSARPGDTLADPASVRDANALA